MRKISLLSLTVFLSFLGYSQQLKPIQLKNPKEKRVANNGEDDDGPIVMVMARAGLAYDGHSATVVLEIANGTVDVSNLKDMCRISLPSSGIWNLTLFRRGYAR